MHAMYFSATEQLKIITSYLSLALSPVILKREEIAMLVGIDKECPSDPEEVCKAVQHHLNTF